MPRAKNSQKLSLFGDELPTANSQLNPKKKKPDSARQSTDFASTKDLLNKYQFREQNKHISHEFQGFGCYLAETLADKKHTALYIKLAKTMSRGLLERALQFVIDSTADNKAKLFMWKLEQLKKTYEASDH
jgi:hypothetical protein